MKNKILITLLLLTITSCSYIDENSIEISENIDSNNLINNNTKENSNEIDNDTEKFEKEFDELINILLESSN